MLAVPRRVELLLTVPHVAHTDSTPFPYVHTRLMLPPAATCTQPPPPLPKGPFEAAERVGGEVRTDSKLMPAH